MFLTCYWFAKFGSKEMIMCDSTIANNYINGGQELCDNECFEFGYYNAATITHNFIDYYRTIYPPPRLPIHVDLQARFLKATNTKCSSIFIILKSPNSLI